MIQKLHLHRHITLAALIAGIASLGILFGSIVSDLTPLLQIKLLAPIVPKIEMAIEEFGGFAAICTAVAALGHSVTDYFHGNDK